METDIENKEIINKSRADRLKQCIKNSGLKEVYIAQKYKCTPAYINKLKNGKNTITYEIAKRICHILECESSIKVSPEYIMCETSIERPHIIQEKGDLSEESFSDSMFMIFLATIGFTFKFHVCSLDNQSNEDTSESVVKIDNIDGFCLTDARCTIITNGGKYEAIIRSVSINESTPIPFAWFSFYINRIYDDIRYSMSNILSSLTKQNVFTTMHGMIEIECGFIKENHRIPCDSKSNFIDSAEITLRYDK